jgi:hypothetical protein
MQPGRISVAREQCAYAAVLEIANNDETRRLLTTVKVKAHVDHRGLEGVERWKAIGNGFADKFALAAEYSIHPQPGARMISDITTNMNHVKATVRVMAALLPLWGFESKKHVRVKRPAGEVGVAAAVSDKVIHKWVLHADRWRCAVCRAVTETVILPEARVNQRCTGLKDHLSAGVAHQFGHVLVEVTAADGNFTICSVCGAFGSRRAVNLALQCPGELRTRRGKESHSRVFKNGRHPRTNRALTRCHFSAHGSQNVPSELLRSEFSRASRRRRLATKTKPWVAAALGIMEEPKTDIDECDNGDDPSRGMDEDPYGSDAEEQDPFGHTAAVS